MIEHAFDRVPVMAGKVSPLDEGAAIERVWWNGADRRSRECLHLALGTLPGRAGWFLWRSDTGRWTRFGDRDDALSRVLPVVEGWVPMIGDLADPFACLTEA